MQKLNWQGAGALVGLALAWVYTVPVYADWVNPYNGMQFSNMYGAMADTTMSQMIRAPLSHPIQSSLPSASSNMATPGQSAMPRQTAPQAAPAVPAGVRYVQNVNYTDFKPAGKRDMPEQYGAQYKGSAAERAQFIQACRQIVMAVESDKEFRRNNLAYAMTIALGAAMQVYYGVELSDAYTDYMVRTLNDALSMTPNYKTLNDETKTRMYDAFLITGGLMAGFAQTAVESHNQELAKQTKAWARDTLIQFGFKL